MELAVINELTYKVRGAIFKVYCSLGPGLLESVYAAPLAALHDVHKKQLLPYLRRPIKDLGSLSILMLQR